MATGETRRVRGKWIVIPLVMATAITAAVFLTIQFSGRGAAKTNFIVLSYTAGLRDLDDGYYLDAAKNFTPVIESGMKPAAYGWRGEAYLRLKEYAVAEADFREAVEIEPDVPANHAGLGYALAEQDKFDEALPHFDKAIELLERTDAPPPATVRRWGDRLSEVVDRRANVLDALGRSRDVDGSGE